MGEEPATEADAREPLSGAVRLVDRIVDATPKEPTPQVDAHRRAFTPGDRSANPFVVLSEDWFSSVGFDWHPHRGFETVTIVVEGQLQHGDNAGGRGVLGPGDVQWVTAGSGGIHSELARRREPVHTLQLWLNLPSAKKMVEPRYQDLRSAEAPFLRRSGTEVRVFSGVVQGERGVAENHWPATVLDARFEAGGRFDHEVPEGYTGLIYVVRGSVQLGPGGTEVRGGQSAWIDASPSGAARVRVVASEASHLVAYAAAPIDEPVVAYGPFVMNTTEEIHEAIADYQRGRFGPIPS